MEWSEFLESSFCPNLEALQMAHTGWDYEENKTFENALGELGFGCPDLLQKVAARIPGKSFEEVVSHFASLVQDIEIIESEEVLGTDHDQKQGSSATTPISTLRRGLPWTVQEHKLFLVGLIAYGKGDWRSISRHCVKTRSPTQVASHAQKYFKRHSISSASSSSSSSSSSRRKRRCSIHDTQISFDDTSISSLLPDIFHMLHPSSSSNINEKDNPNSPTPSTIGCKEFEEN